MIILRLTDEGEVFYKQIRIGKDGKEFNIYKFVTMVKNSPNIGAKDITLKNDPRVLPFGKLLRKTKLNEFPQFLNVLIGNMSLVGPRPLVINQYNMIPAELKSKIKKLKPGITGIGSIVFRNEENYLKENKEKSNEFYKNEIVPYKALLECWYLDNNSIIIDIILILITIVLIFSSDSRIYNKIFPNIPKHQLFNPND